MKKYHCSICGEEASLRDLDVVFEPFEELGFDGIYIHRQGRGCLSKGRYYFDDRPAPYQSLKIRKVED